MNKTDREFLGKGLHVFIKLPLLRYSTDGENYIIIEDEK